MRRLALLSALWLFAVFVGLNALAQTPPIQPPKLTPEQEEKLKSRERLSQEAESLLKEGKLGEVRTRVEKYLDITKEVLGDSNPEVVQLLDGLIDICVQLEDFPAARGYGQKLLTATRKINGDKHWKAIDAQLKLTEVDIRGKLTKEQRGELNDIGRMMVEMRQYLDRGKYQRAEALAENALSQVKEILGEKHSLYVTSLNNLAMLHQSRGMIAKAAPIFKEALALQKDILGDKHPLYANSLSNLATVYHYQNLFAKAAPLFQEALAIFRETFGEDNPDYTNCLTSLAIVYGKQGMLDKAEPLFKASLAIQEKKFSGKPHEYAAALNSTAMLYDSQGLFSRAEPLFIKAGSMIKETAGERSPEVATFLSNLGLRYSSRNMFSKAELHFKDALSIYKEIVGEKHIAYVNCLQNLAHCYRDQGLYAKAEPIYKEVQSFYKEMKATKTADYARFLNTLAQLHREQGSYLKAESLYNEALAICKEALGDAHPDYGAILQNLADLHVLQGLFVKAEALDKEAAAISKNTFSAKHPLHARILNKLAFVYERLGKLDESERLIKEALAIRKEALGETHQEYTAALRDLALLHEKQKMFARAEPLLKDALEINKSILGVKHPDYAASLNHLASLYFSEGMFAQAEPLFQEALKVRESALGARHPSTVESLNNLACVYRSQDMTVKARLLDNKALSILEDNLQETAAGLSESGQSAFTLKTRGYLNRLLEEKDANPTEIYASVLRWRGAIASRQAFQRAARQCNPDPFSFIMLEEVRSVSQQLSNLINDPPKMGSGVDIAKLTNELNDLRETLEIFLSSTSKGFSQYCKNRSLAPAEIQKLLPANAAVIDFLAHDDKIAAFIIAPTAIVRVDLKGGQELADLVEEFSKPSSLKRTHPVQNGDDRSLLYKTVWEPLSPHLKGTSLILICPEGPLCRLPFAALRGTDPKKYLIEEVAIAILSVPNLLPEMFAGRSGKPSLLPSLLSIGDVDFNCNPGADKLPGESSVNSTNRAGGPIDWKPLTATKGEIEAIEKLFKQEIPAGKYLSLTQERATEAAIRREMSKHRYLHFATHGFFAAPGKTLKPGLAANEWVGESVRTTHANPNLMCGLVCAGANKPTPDDDGILTAQEILELNLDGVELAVLSACEANVGKSGAGDFIVGLQKAFQSAGARTTVASLWKVPDNANSILLSRFYENVFKKHLPALEALRETQLWVLNNGVKAGILSEEPKDGERTPPLYWAASSLAGDWR